MNKIRILFTIYLRCQVPTRHRLNVTKSQKYQNKNVTIAISQIHKVGNVIWQKDWQEIIGLYVLPVALV